jgi:hypothetical protein
LNLGYSNPDLTIVTIEDFLAGAHYKHIVKTVVYNFNSEGIALNWDKNDILLTLTLIDWEFVIAPEVIDDDYKPVFVYLGEKYNCVSEKLILNIHNSNITEGFFLFNIPVYTQRSFFLLFDKKTGESDNSCFEVYYNTVNCFLK